VDCQGEATFFITKGVSKQTANPGNTLTYTINVTNTSTTVNATNVEVIDSLPSYTTFLTASDGGTNNGGVVRWTGLAINAGQTKTVTLNVRVSDSAPNGTTITNTALVNGQQAQVSTVIQGGTGTGTNLTITISDSKDPVEPCENFNYTVIVTNLNSTQVTGQTVTLQLDNDTSYISSTSGGSHSSNIVTWSNQTIPANGSINLSATVKTDCSANDNDMLYTTASVGNKSDQESTRVDDNGNDNEDVTIRITDDEPDPVEPGEVLTYDIRVCNEDNSDANVDVRAFLDSETSFLSASDSGDDTSNDEVEWDDISINGDDCETLVLRVRVLSTARDGDILRVRARTSDEEDEENTRVVEPGPGPGPIPPGPIPPGPGEPATLSLDKSADRREVQPGSIASYTITIRNTSPYVIESMTVEDSFTAGSLSVEDAAGGQVLGNTITWQVPLLGANATRIIHYRVRIDSAMRHGQTITNTVTATSPDLAGSPSDTEMVGVVEHLPQTGLGGFISSLNEVKGYTSPHARSSVTSPGASAGSGALPIIIWTNIIAIGVSGGLFIGRRFFFI